MRHKSGASAVAHLQREQVWVVRVLVEAAHAENFYASVQTVPDAARSRDLSSQRGNKNAVALSVVFPPFDV